MREKQEGMTEKFSYIFIKNGLYKTTNKVLSRELHISEGNIYTYFDSKDDMIIECAKEAVHLISKNVFYPCIKEVFCENTDINKIINICKKNYKIMSFVLQVYTEEYYKPLLIETINKNGLSFHDYANKLAKERCKLTEKLDFNLSAFISNITNYLVFNDETYARPQLEIIIKKIKEEIK